MVDIPTGIQLTPFDPEFANDPYGVYARLREAAPVHYDGASYTVSGYAEVEALLKDRRLSVDPRKVGQERDPRADNPVTRRDPDLMNLDDPEHARLRSLVKRAFTVTSISAFRPSIEALAESLVEKLPAEFDAIESFAGPLPALVIAEFMGIDSSHYAEFLRWTDTLRLQGYPLPTEEQWQLVIDADDAMRSCMQEIVRERKHQRRDDFISRLLEADASEAEVVEMCALLVGAGIFTTADLIGNALLRFSDKDRTRIPEFVEDTLRLDPPSQSVRRWALEDVEISDSKIKAGSQVLLLIGAANHDPAAGSHLSFGAGIHHCLGASLARLETEIALKAFPPFEVRSFKRRKSLMFRGCSEVRVALR